MTALQHQQHAHCPVCRHHRPAQDHPSCRCGAIIQETNLKVPGRVSLQATDRPTHLLFRTLVGHGDGPRSKPGGKGAPPKPTVTNLGLSPSVNDVQGAVPLHDHPQASGLLEAASATKHCSHQAMPPHVHCPDRRLQEAGAGPPHKKVGANNSKADIGSANTKLAAEMS